jgi:signal transduction histidine kinase
MVGLSTVRRAIDPPQSNSELTELSSLVRRIASATSGAIVIRRIFFAAFTDATAQAITNSIQHAGGKASRLLRLKASAKEVKIVVKDDGIGFWASRVPKARLGLRLSIIERVESVGGSVHIDSKPGHGTSIVMEWQFDD